MAEITAMRNVCTPYPLYGLPWVVVAPLLDADGDPVSPSSPDSEISKNGDTFADCTNEATEIATSSGVVYLSLTGTELTTDIATIRIQSTGAKTTVLTLLPRKLVSIRAGTSASGGVSTSTIVLDGSASAVDDFYNGMIVAAVIDSVTEVRMITDYTGSTQTATVTPDWNTAPDNNDTFTVYLPDGVQIQQANTTHLNSTAQTARDIGASVLLSSGTGTGQLDFTSGVVKSNLTQIGGSAVSTSTAQLGVNVVNFGGSAGTFASGRPEVNTTHIAGSAVSTSSAQIGVNVVNAGGTAWGSGAITAASIATGAIDADALAADAGTEIGTAVWATAARTLTALDEDSTTLDIDTTIRSALGLTDNNLDTRLSVLEDAAFLIRTTIATLASQTSFTLTAGSADNDAYNDCVIVIQDATTAAQKAVAVIDDYTGSTKTVTLRADPAVFTMATTDIVTILADRSLKPTVMNRTLDVTATGAAGIDWGNVENPTTTVGLSGTTVKTATDVETDTADIQSRLPAALVSGRIDASVGAYQTGLTPLQPTTSGRTLDVTAGGCAGIDWANVEAPTTSLALTGTTIATTQKVDIETIKTQSVTCGAGVTVGAYVGQGTAAIGVNASGHVSRVVLVDTVTTLTGHTAQTGDAYAIVASGTYGNSALKTLIDAVDDYVDSEVSAIKTVTDRLSGMLELDGAVYRYTTNSLEQSPTGAGGFTSDDRTTLETIPTLSEIWTTALTEAYASDGAAFTPAQGLFMIWSALTEFAVSGTSITCKKLDGSTTSMVFTMDSSTAPTSRTRSS